MNILKFGPPIYRLDSRSVRTLTREKKINVYSSDKEYKYYVYVNISND